MIRKFGGIAGLEMQPTGLDVGLGGEGSPNPLDWSAYDTVYDWSIATTSVPATSYGTFLDIAGEGYLVFARGDSTVVTSRNPDVRITVDGIVYVFAGIDAGAQSQGNALVSPIYYKTSLKIELFNRAAVSNTLRCDYTYLRKTKATSKTQTLLISSNRKMAYAITTSVTNTDVVNITGSGYLLAIEFSGFYTSAGGTTYGTVTVDSVIKMNDRSAFGSMGESPKTHNYIGPVRFATNCKVQHRLNVTGSTALTRVWYVLD